MRPIPLRPDAGALVERNVNALARVAIAKALARLDPRCDARNHLRIRWPEDSTGPLILRAASEPATLASNPALGRTLIADLIATIGPTGAGARLLQAGLQLVFGSASAIYVPGLEANADKVAFVREGAPIPVHGLTATVDELGKRLTEGFGGDAVVLGERAGDAHVGPSVPEARRLQGLSSQNRSSSTSRTVATIDAHAAAASLAI
jgi:hypothetical protein